MTGMPWENTCPASIIERTSKQETGKLDDFIPFKLDELNKVALQKLCLHLESIIGIVMGWLPCWSILPYIKLH